jgi:hypothetical protein
MTDTTITPKDETPTDPPAGGGSGDGTNGQHEGNGVGGGTTTASPMGQHEGNSPAR